MKNFYDFVGRLLVLLSVVHFVSFALSKGVFFYPLDGEKNTLFTHYHVSERGLNGYRSGGE